jgi:hypothetical protein
MKTTKIFFVLVILFTNSFAQKSFCGYDEYVEFQKKYDKSLQQKLSETDASWTSFVEKDEVYKTQNLATNLYQIPVVFHIMHTGQALGTDDNPNDTTIQAWVNYVNKVFATEIDSFPNEALGGVKVPIRLILAKRKPDCGVSNGIVRVNLAANPTYNSNGVNYLQNLTGIHDTILKNYSNYSNKSYLNIWIVKNIQSSSTTPVTGYTAPVINSIGKFDGIVLHKSYVTNAIVHEVGHYLGLKHTFEGGTANTCPPNNNCNVEGDLICDTPPHKIMTQCSSNTNDCTGGSLQSILKNFMNTNECSDRFTFNQKDKMVFTILNLRNNLLTSLAAFAPGNNPTNYPEPIENCDDIVLDSIGNILNYGPKKVKFNTIDYVSEGYNLDNFKFYINNTLNTCTQRQQVTTIQQATNYILTVSRSNNAPQRTAAWLDWDNNGIFEDEEKILNYNSTNPIENVTSNVITPNGDSTFVTCKPLRLRVVSDTNLNTELLPCDTLEYGQTEDFTVIIKQFIPISKINASLRAIVSPPAIYQWVNCANGSYTIIPGAVNQTFVPPVNGTYAVIVKKDLCIDTSACFIIDNVGLYEYEILQTVTIFPNPAQDFITIDSAPNLIEKYQIFEINGKLVSEDNVTNNNTISIEKLTSGIYFLNLRSREGYTRKIKFLKQ